MKAYEHDQQRTEIGWRTNNSVMEGVQLGGSTSNCRHFKFSLKKKLSLSQKVNGQTRLK